MTIGAKEIRHLRKNLQSVVQVLALCGQRPDWWRKRWRWDPSCKSVWVAINDANSLEPLNISSSKWHSFPRLRTFVFWTAKMIFSNWECWEMSHSLVCNLSSYLPHYNFDWVRLSGQDRGWRNLLVPGSNPGRMRNFFFCAANYFWWCDIIILYFVSIYIIYLSSLLELG